MKKLILAAVLILIACSPEATPTITTTTTSTPVTTTTTIIAPTQGFSFAAAGDIGANSRSTRTLASLDRSGANFFVALGDLDYDQTSSDAAWCSYVKTNLPTLGSDFPFQLVVGNHEEQGGPDGYIQNHVQCLPDKLNSVGKYGTEYYFDYPISNPLMRVINVAADITVDDLYYRYNVGSPNYSWLTAAIDSARAAGIPWVTVTFHKPCITAGDKDCEPGSGILNLLVEKKVDLILMGHDHNYQRTRQLTFSSECPRIAPNAFNPSCVTGGANSYTKGSGSLYVIVGTFGRSGYPISSSDSEFPYFQATNGSVNGYLQVDVTRNHLDGRFVRTEGTSFSDSFTVGTT